MVQGAMATPAHALWITGDGAVVLLGWSGYQASHGSPTKVLREKALVWIDDGRIVD